MLASMASEQPLSERLDSLPSFPSARGSQPFKAEERGQVVERLGAEMSGLDCDRLLTLDGFRAEFPDGWLLVRLSGTEPKLRTTAEARDQEELERLQGIVRGVVGRCLA